MEHDYHYGSVEVVKTPDVNHSYRTLDFGKGFYVTTVKEQAEKWAICHMNSMI